MTYGLVSVRSRMSAFKIIIQVKMTEKDNVGLLAAS